MHDYIGWLIGGIAIVITVAIYFKQQGIIDNLQKTEQSLKSNSLKILNYYIETCGISLGKTASSVKADILNDRLTLDELKEVLKTDEYYFRMTDIMNKELAFVRPRISIGLHQIFYRAIDGLSSLHDPEKIDNYNNPKIWLNEIIEVLTPAIADAREKLETELKQMELKPNLLDGTHKLKNRCSLKKINFRDPLITNIAIVILTAVVAGFVIYEYYLDNFPPVINTEGGDIYLNLGNFPGFVMPKGILINPIGPHFLRFTVTDVKLLDLDGQQYAKCFFAESPNVTLWRPSSIILNKDGDLKQLDPDLIISYRTNPNFQYAANNETGFGQVQLGGVMFYLTAQDLQETQKSYQIQVSAPLVARLPPNLYHFITNNCKY